MKSSTYSTDSVSPHDRFVLQLAVAAVSVVIGLGVIVLARTGWLPPTCFVPGVFICAVAIIWPTITALAACFRLLLR